MKWWDFTNFEFIVFFVFMVLIVLFIIVLITTLIILDQKNKKYSEQIFDEKNTTRIFVINIRKNLVTFFDLNNIKRKREKDLLSFYNNFNENDIEKIKGWVFAISMQNPNVASFIEAEILIGQKQIPYLSILKLLKYSEKDGIIYIESNVMKFITPSSSTSFIGKNPYGIVTKDAMADLVNNAKTTDGFLFGIRFIFLGQKIIYDGPVEKYILWKTKNEVYPFCKGSRHTRQLLDYEDNKMFLLDLHLKTREEAIALANSIQKEINKSILINGYDKTISVTISVVANSLFYRDFDTLFDRAEISTIDSKGQGKGVVFYEKNALFSVRTETTKFNNQINHLINNKNAIRYLYKPVLKASSGNVVAYISSLRLYDSPFSNLFEASRYASKINKNKELIASVVKNVVTTFSSEIVDKNIKLFFKVSLLGIDNLKEVISTNNHIKTINFSLVLYENELSDILNEGKTINDVYKELSGSEYSLSLLVTKNTLNLDPSFYPCFDYFILDGSLTREIRRSNRSRLKLLNLLDSLYKYRKPVIAADLEGWSSIEIAIKSGINYISSETIAPSSDMLLPVDKKKSSKIAIMANKYK